jgi:hypothetical protein
MADKLTKKALYVDLATMSDGDFPIVGDFGKYYNITISADWVDLDTADAVIGIIERSAATQAWKLVDSYTCSVTPGSQDLTYGNFGSKHIGIRIEKGTASAGKFTIYLTAKSN